MKTAIQFHILKVGDQFYRKEYDEMKCTKSDMNGYKNCNGIYFEMLYWDTVVYIKELEL